MAKTGGISYHPGNILEATLARLELGRIALIHFNRFASAWIRCLGSLCNFSSIDSLFTVATSVHAAWRRVTMVELLRVRSPVRIVSFFPFTSRV